VAESTVAEIYADASLGDVLVASGYGVTISVRSGHLVIADGIGHHRRERRIPRLPRTVRRLTIVGHTGYMSLESVRWLADAGIPWAQLDISGEIIATSGRPAREDSRLLRAQANAMSSEIGIAITRYLITVKLNGQADVLADVFRSPGTATMIRELSDELARCATLDGLRSWESQAAVLYFRMWADRVTAPFSPADMLKVPGHWFRYQGRTSLVHDGYQLNKAASQPANSLLNFLYKIAETECTHALHALGLSPRLGVLHTDQPGRDSMSLDLLEAVRPAADRIALSLLDTGLGVPYDDRGRPTYLDRKWFAEQKDGSVRICAPLTHDLAAHAPAIAAEIRPHAERVVKLLAGSATGDVRLPRQKSCTVKPVPPSSTRRARLRPGVTVADLVPEWETLRELIPQPSRPDGKKGRPVSADDRLILACLVAHELLGVPWTALPFACTQSTARARLRAWSWTETGGISVWDQISEALISSGHLSALVS
jgi:CRISPR-associated endonuclease Cas1